MSEETTIWEGTPSQYTNIKCYVLCGLFSWMVLPLFFIYWQYLKTKNTKFKITTERLIIAEGVFNKKTEQIELYRVKDIHLEEPFVMRIFGLGNIHLDTSDQETSEEIIPAMKNALELKEKIRHIVEDLRVERNVREVDFR